jgi:hypothetical protein
MNKKLNITLVKNLIESDFLLLDSQSKKSVRYFNAKTKTYSQFDTISLDVLQLAKALKQFIRVFQFIKTQEKPRINIWVENEQHLEIFDRILGEYTAAYSVTVTVGLSRDSQAFNFSRLLLVLGKTLNNDKNVFKKLFESNIFLVSKINSGLEAKNWATYKIYNQLNDYKKIIFLSVLINQILNK